MAVSGNLGGKVPIVDDVLSSHEQEIYPTTSLDENCIEFEFQTDRNCFVDLRQALKLNFAKGRGSDTYERKETKKEHKDESIVFTETGDDSDQEEEVARVTYVNIQYFQMLKCL